MSPSDLKETAAEISEWDEFYRSVTKYGFSKNFFKKENIVLPGIKTFFSIPVESTEKSDFSSVAILDETADSKDTVLKVLNILYDKFQVGQLTNYVIVVGDGKSYDHLIKLKSEYGEQMDWVLAYPGDWHIYKNVLPIFVKIYFDAGLRQLATKHHHGATLKVLTECSKFAVTHRTYETAGKPPSRKRRNLKTFAPIKITIHKQKKEIKDQNTVISCLRKKIAFSKHSGNAVKDLDQFLQLPRALCDAEGIPEKGQKATAANVFKNIYSDAFLLQVPKAPVSSKTTVIIDAGGFDDDRKARAISILKGQVVDYDLASGNHEEADTRVWLHASVTTADQVIIYSPDTDVFFIGLPLVSDLNKTVYVQLRDSPYNNSFLSMDKLVKCITLNDSLLQGIDSVLICMQLLFIYSGCDFVSYFRGCGKKTFFDVFRKHASFIVGNGSFSDVHGHNGLYSFYRLICSVYFSKHRAAAFQPYSTPKSLFDSISEGDLHEKHISFISAIREKLWERVVTEVEMMPNHEALKLHWMRCCWVFDYWSQSTSNTHALSDLSKCGWQITDNRLEIVWDTVLNFQKVEKNYSGDQVLDMSIDLDDVISDDTEEFEDPVEVEQPELDGLVEQLDQTDDYWLFSTEEI
ncbi:Hypothetical predicted protein [Mytilus galloprovincialis]|uniref:Uncharacterized protein n=1 Tax=Mytilus galloprovincialis TaxID=29158 RepID=A0A8B6FW82_MYTGA|nr:Hypothetical predicted protein [Mytilus galloprovincialis]